MLRDAVDESFNCISVEGHMSTNDTVLLLARRASDATNLAGADRAAFSSELREMSIQLACEIPSDGEGATHLIEIHVGGCGSRDEAHQIARTIADSPLVKTAVAGADPNWGRIVSAAGYSGVAFDPTTASLRLNGFLLFHEGAPVAFDASQVSASIQNQRTTRTEFQLKRGDHRVQFWTCDLTAEYVRLNADYHT
jgi:glutamate N-acetyltransferase/amino-acid N-acetyltransferase